MPITRRDFIKRTGGLALLLSVGGLAGACSNAQPTPRNPIRYTGIPRDVVEVKGHWKMGDYTQGFRIEFDDCFATTGYQGLFGQEGMSLGGPGMVPYATVESFREIADLCERIKDKEEISLHGDLAKTKSGMDYFFHGKKVILLYDATYKGRFMEVNRRPWDN